MRSGVNQTRRTKSTGGATSVGSDRGNRGKPGSKPGSIRRDEIGGVGDAAVEVFSMCSRREAPRLRK